MVSLIHRNLKNSFIESENIIVVARGWRRGKWDETVYRVESFSYKKINVLK